MLVRSPRVATSSFTVGLHAPDEPGAGGAWTAERLEHWLRASTDVEPVIVVSQRAPGASRGRNEPATAVEPLIRACSGLWMAPSDASDGADAARIHPFRIERVALEPDAARAHAAFASDALWAMCHRAHVKPAFNADDFTTYRRVNARFAEAVDRSAAGAAPLVLIQDHHFALAPLLIRERRPSSRIVTFWHIPWPDWQTFEICPWGQHLLEGLLGSSIVGFQTPLDCRNFVETVERCLGAHMDRHQEAVTYDGRRVLVRAYPASVRWPDWWSSCAPDADTCRSSIRQQLGLPPDVRLGVGVDRLDPSKGVEEKFLAIERLLECYPEFRGRFVFAQLAAPCQEGPAICRQVRERIQAVRDRVNAAYRIDGLDPILLLEDEQTPSYVNLFLRAADLCYVGSLHDGMHLVAKEFVAARDDERGVLVLSTFAGAAHELTESLIVNPYDVDGAASVLARALAMSSEEQTDRMRRLRGVVAEFSACRWAAQILSDAARLRRQR